MTAPDYKFNDERLKAYLDYLQYVIDPMTSEINGIQMSYSLQADYSAVTLQVSAGPFVEMSTPNSRSRLDLTLFREARLVMHCITDANGLPEYGIEYSTDDGVTWNWMNDTYGPTVQLYGEIDPFVYAGPWVTLESAAQADVWIRLVGTNNEGVAAVRNVRVAQTHIEFRTLWSFEDPVMTYDERIQYLSDNQLPPFD